MKPTQLFIHNIEVTGSAKTEDEIEKIIQQMYVYQNMKKDGTMQNPEEVNVHVVGRNLNVKQHNTWV